MTLSMPRNTVPVPLHCTPSQVATGSQTVWSAAARRTGSIEAAPHRAPYGSSRGPFFNKRSNVLNVSLAHVNDRPIGTFGRCVQVRSRVLLGDHFYNSKGASCPVISGFGPVRKQFLCCDSVSRAFRPSIIFDSLQPLHW